MGVEPIPIGIAEGTVAPHRVIVGEPLDEFRHLDVFLPRGLVSPRSGKPYNQCLLVDG